MDITTTRRRFLGATALGLGAAAMTSCGAGGASGTFDGTLRLWHGFTEADGQVVQQIIDAFNESQDEYQVVAETMAWSSLTEKLLTSLSSGDGPHIVAQGADSGEGYIAQKAFLPVEDFYTDGTFSSTEHLFPNIVDFATWDGQRCAVPMSAAAFSVWYNKAHFEAAGLSEDDVPQDVEGLRELARTLTTGSDQYGIALPDGDTGTLATMLHSGGGDFITDGTALIDSPENVATLTEWQTSWTEDKVSPTGMDLVAAAQLFNSGKASLLMNGPWQATGSADSGIDAGVFSWPSDWIQAATTFWFASSMVDSDEKKKAVYTFLDFWNSRDQQVLWTTSGYPPNRDDIPADEVENELVAQMAEYTSSARMAITGVTKNYTDITAETVSMTQQIAEGGDVATLVAETQAAVEEYLNG